MKALILVLSLFSLFINFVAAGCGGSCGGNSGCGGGSCGGSSDNDCKRKKRTVGELNSSRFISALADTDKDGNLRYKRQWMCGGYGGNYGDYGNFGNFGLGGLGGLSGLGGLNNILPLIVDAGAVPRTRQDPPSPEVIVVTVPVPVRGRESFDVTPVPDAEPLCDKACVEELVAQALMERENEKKSKNKEYKVTRYGVNVVPKAGGGYRVVTNRDDFGRKKAKLGESCEGRVNEPNLECEENQQCEHYRTGAKPGKYCQCTPPHIESPDKSSCVSPHGRT